LKIREVALPDGSRLPDDNVIATHLIAWINQTIKVKLVIAAMPATGALSEVWHLKLLILLLSIRVSPKECTSEEASVDRRLINNDRVFLIVAGVASNGDHGVATSW
jgi:hypothetical protein